MRRVSGERKKETRKIERKKDREGSRGLTVNHTLLIIVIHRHSVSRCDERDVDVRRLLLLLMDHLHGGYRATASKRTHQGSKRIYVKARISNYLKKKKKNLYPMIPLHNECSRYTLTYAYTHVYSANAKLSYSLIIVFNRRSRGRNRKRAIMAEKGLKQEIYTHTRKIN